METDPTTTLARRVGPRVARAAGALVAAFGAVAVFLGYAGLGVGADAAGVVVACWLTFALYRAASDASERRFPTIGELVLVVALATAAGFGVAWWSERDRDPVVFDFVAVPREAAAMVSLAPRPDTEVESAGLLVYGTRLGVLCRVEVGDDRTWYRLESGYFVFEDDVEPDPLSDDDPPRC